MSRVPGDGIFLEARAPSDKLQKDLDEIERRAAATIGKLNRQQVKIKLDAGELESIQREANMAFSAARFQRGLPSGPTNVGGGVEDILRSSRNIYGASRVAHAAASLLDTYGAFSSRSRAVERGDFEGETAANDRLTAAAKSIPFAGHLGVAIRDNVWQRENAAYIEDVTDKTNRQNKDTDRVQRNAQDEASAIERAKGLAHGITGAAMGGKSLEEQQAYSLSQAQKQISEFQRTIPNPAMLQNPQIKKQLDQAFEGVFEMWRTAQVDAIHRQHDMWARGRVLSNQLMGDTDMSRREVLGLELTQEQRAQYKIGRQEGDFFRDTIAPQRRKLLDREIAHGRLADAGESGRNVDASYAGIQSMKARSMGETGQADLYSYKAVWDQKLQKAREAVELETDIVRRGLRQQELAAIESERAVALETFKIYQDKERNRTAWRLENERRVQEELAAGHTEAARMLADKAARDDRFRGITDNDELVRTSVLQDAQQRREQADRDRDVRRLQGENREEGLRQAGRGGIASTERALRELNEGLEAADGDPSKQQALRQRAVLQLEQARREALGTPVNRGEVLRGFSNIDVRNRAGASQNRDAEAILKKMQEIREAIEKAGKQPTVTS